MRKIQMKRTGFGGSGKVINGFYLGFWQDGTKYTRKIATVVDTLKNIGGMNKILTDVGSWLNVLLCAGLVKVYFAE